MSVIGTLGVILLVSFLVEALVEAVLGEPFNHYPALAPFKWLLKYAAFAAGVGGAFVYRFDFVALAGLHLGALINVTPYGIVLTGLAIGRGAQFVHEIIGWFKKPNMPQAAG